MSHISRLVVKFSMFFKIIETDVILSSIASHRGKNHEHWITLSKVTISKSIIIPIQYTYKIDYHITNTGNQT